MVVSTYDEGIYLLQWACYLLLLESLGSGYVV